jgi:hypothetical protein
VFFKRTFTFYLNFYLHPPFGFDCTLGNSNCLRLENGLRQTHTDIVNSLGCTHKRTKQSFAGINAIITFFGNFRQKLCDFLENPTLWNFFRINGWIICQNCRIFSNVLSKIFSKSNTGHRSISSFYIQSDNAEKRKYVSASS